MAKSKGKTPEKKGTQKGNTKTRRDAKTRNYAADNKTLLRVCICGDRRCRRITKTYIQLNQERGCVTAERRGGWRIIPSTMTPHSPKGKVAVAERKMIFQSIHGEGCTVPESVKGTKLYLSNIHFPDVFLSPMVTKVKYIERSITTSQESDDIFDGREFLRVEDSGEDDYCPAHKYFAGPVLSINDAEALFQDYKAHRAMQEHQSSTLNPSTTTPPRPNSIARPRPTVVAKDTEDMAPGCMKLQEQHEQRCKELKELSVLLQSQEEAHKKEQAALKATITELRKENKGFQREIRNLKKNQHMMKGLTAANLTSDDWHDMNEDAAKYLFGIKSTWNETKLFLQACFPNDIDITDYGNAHISAFEQLLVTLMRAKAGFEEKTLGYIIGKDRTTVNKYLSKWMPKLGRLGVTRDQRV